MCAALGIGNVSYSVSILRAAQVRNAVVREGRARPNKVVSEQGVYDLVFQSRKPEAKAFRDWVTGTVLPAIRKDGGYTKGEEKVVTGEMSEDELVLNAMELARPNLWT